MPDALAVSLLHLLARTWTEIRSISFSPSVLRNFFAAGRSHSHISVEPVNPSNRQLIPFANRNVPLPVTVASKVQHDARFLFLRSLPINGAFDRAKYRLVQASASI